MKVIFGQLRDIYDTETFQYASQLGVKGLNFNTPPFKGKEKGYWPYEEIQALVDRCAQYGLTVDFLENVPIEFYDDIMLGGPRRDEQIENYCKTIENVGRAGVPALGHHFAPNFVWRTSNADKGRGGALISSYNAAIEAQTGNTFVRGKSKSESGKTGAQMAEFSSYTYVDGELPSREEQWKNYAYFLDAVLPTAEKAGVKLAVHPSDPPIEVCGGQPRIFASVEDLKYAEQLSKGSPAWGVNLCLGCISEIGGQESVMECIRHFGPQKKLIQVHFRDVCGYLPDFKECFLDEGNFDCAQVMRALRDYGFDGVIQDDHVPVIANDTSWGHRARAHQTGYIMGLIKMLELVK